MGRKKNKPTEAQVEFMDVVNRYKHAQEKKKSKKSKEFKCKCGKTLTKNSYSHVRETYYCHRCNKEYKESQLQEIVY